MTKVSGDIFVIIPESQRAALEDSARSFREADAALLAHVRRFGFVLPESSLALQRERDELARIRAGDAISIAWIVCAALVRDGSV